MNKNYINYLNQSFKKVASMDKVAININALFKNPTIKSNFANYLSRNSKIKEAVNSINRAFADKSMAKGWINNFQNGLPHATLSDMNKVLSMRSGKALDYIDEASGLVKNINANMSKVKLPYARSWPVKFVSDKGGPLFPQIQPYPIEQISVNLKPYNDVLRKEIRKEYLKDIFKKFVPGF